MRDRTADLLRARQALSQLSYSPETFRLKIFLRRGTILRSVLSHMSKVATKHEENLVGLGRFELPTSPLSGVRSNQLSYSPKKQIIRTDGVDLNCRLHPTLYPHSRPGCALTN